MSIEKKLQEAQDWAVEQAEKASGKADAKADSWVMSAAKWLVASRFTWALLGAGVAAGLILFVL